MNLIFYSFTNSKNIKWESNENDTQMFFSDLKNYCPLSIPIGDKALLLQANDTTVNFVIKYSDDNEIASKYNTRKIIAFVNKLSPQECFYILDGNVTQDIVRLSAFESLNKDNIKDINAVHSSFEASMNSYSDLIKHYTPYAFGFDNLPFSAGEPDKDKRVCRFCGKTGRENFKDVAHAISESLGNKLLACNEECDDCNHTLNKIEDNLIALMDVRRALFRIKRKETNAVPHIDGQNFTIRDDGSGNPMIYVMEESLPEGWQTMDFIPIRLNLKYKTTNENIYKALVKIVVDLIPSQYMPELKETIEWLTSDGKYIPDSLPSCYSAYFHNDIFYEQPQLLLYVKHDRDESLPFCFAILRIYDMCYRYIVPFAKQDKGKFRNDESLKDFWSKFETRPKLNWYKQDTYEWWSSAPWADFDIKRTAPFLKILPSGDSAFDKCRERPLPKEKLYPVFDSKNIEIEFKTLSFKDYAKKKRISQDELSNTNNDFNGILFTFDNISNSIRIDFSFTARAADKYQRYFGIKICAYAYSPDFADQIEFDDNGITGVNANFIAEVWDKVLAEASRQIDNKKKLTQFRNISIGKYFTSDNSRFFRESVYVFTDSNGGFLRIPFKCMHEDMPESKRKELISRANGRI